MHPARHLPAAVALLAWSVAGAAPPAECAFIADRSTRWTGDAERIICQAPRAARERLIGIPFMHGQFETDVFAAALLNAEQELRAPASWAGDPVARQRRNDIRAMVQALEHRNDVMYPGEQPFGYQWRVLSGELQAADGDMLILPLVPVWRDWSAAGMPSIRAQADAAFLVRSAYGDAPTVEYGDALPAQPPDPVPIAGPPGPLRPFPVATARVDAPDRETAHACPARYPDPDIDSVAVAALLEARRKSLASGPNHIEYGGYVLRASNGDAYSRFGGIALDDGSRIFSARPARGEDGYIMSRHKYCSLQRQGLAQLFRPDGSQPPEICGRGDRATRAAEANGEGPYGPLHPSLEPGLEVIASYHVHPKRQSGLLRYPVDRYIYAFSTGDIRVAVGQQLPEYIITPSCAVRAFHPQGWHTVSGRLLRPWCHFRTIDYTRSCNGDVGPETGGGGGW